MEYSEKYKPSKNVFVIKKDGSKVPFDVQKVINAVQKSAFRAMVTFSEEDKENICRYVIKRVDDSGDTEIHIPLMHNIVEGALESEGGPGKVVNGGDSATVKVGNDKAYALDEVENPVPDSPSKKEIKAFGRASIQDSS